MTMRLGPVHQEPCDRLELALRRSGGKTHHPSGSHRAQSRPHLGEPFLRIISRIILRTIFILCVAAPVAWGQDFPYAVPQAPEFDDHGKETPADRTPAQSQKPTYHAPAPSAPRSQPAPQSSGAMPPSAPQYRQTQPYQPQEPAPQPTRRSKKRSQQQREYAGPPPGAPQQQPQQNVRPDCSQYPMAIARAQSEPQMQDIARSYLTCLLQNGWQMDQARQQVITTIESTYRLTR